MSDGETAQLDELVTSLLYEGYALYPYTPEATKNATPTPFGIVYPPGYARQTPSTFDHARVECLAVPGPGAALRAVLHTLVPRSAGHRADRRRVELGPTAPGERVSVAFDGGRFTLRSEIAPGGRLRVRSCVHNTAVVEPPLDRRAALEHALVSTHVVLTISAGRFLSPLDSGCESVNIWPVLATPSDDAILGAAIVLPDHPQIAPASQGNLFDNTEIEEALLLHVHALTDAERALAAGEDPAVREMIERALAVTPDQIMALHGELKTVDRDADG